MSLYVPGTNETDPKKIIRSQQLVAGQTSTNTDNISTNTTNIATNTTNIASLQSSRASSSSFGLAKVDGTTIVASSGVISTSSNIPLKNAANSFTDSTASTSTTTGAMTVAGGISSQAQMVSPRFFAAGDSTLVPHFDTNGSPRITIANGSNAVALPAGSYFLLYVAETANTGFGAVFVLANSVVTFVGGSSHWVAGTTPGAGNYSVGWNGSRYAIYNAQGSSGTFALIVLAAA